MSATQQSFPIKTLSNGDAVVEICDGTTPSQKLAVDSSGKISSKLNDGSGNLLTSQSNGAQRALDVGIDVAGVQVDPRQIRALTAADIVTANQGTANATPWNENIAQIAGAIPSATNALPAQVATAGAFVSSTNPLPVTVVSTLAGTSVNKYNTTSSVAAGASTNHDYTITALKTFFGKKFWASSAGMIRMDVQTSPDGSVFTTFWTAFSSTACPNISIDLDQLVISDSGTGSKIRIVLTNFEVTASEDLFSTISGTEV